MPRFKSTQNIFIDHKEVYDENWFDKPFLNLPPNPKWDNSRPLQVEDVDIWEVISEHGGVSGVYASWCPYAEFYMLVLKGNIDSTYYGVDSDKYLAKRLDELNILYPRKNDTMGVR